MDGRTTENQELKLNIEDFSTVCRICLKHNGFTPFQQTFFELYTRLLNMPEVVKYFNHLCCSLTFLIFRFKIILKCHNRFVKNVNIS